MASLRQLAMREVPAHVRERVVALARHVAGGLCALVQPAARANGTLVGIYHPSGIRVRIRDYERQTYLGRLTLFRATGHRIEPVEDPSYGWSGIARDGLTVHTVPGDHLTMFLAPNVDVLARKLAAEIEQVDAAVTARAGSGR